jgi:hypothetical protein
VHASLIESTVSPGEPETTLKTSAKEDDSRIKHLNSTHRKALEDGMVETLNELQQYVDEAKFFGCEVKETLEVEDMNTFVSETTNASDVCGPILTNIQSLKMKYLVFQAVKALDDEVCSSELSMTKEERKKRSAESRTTLASIDEQLIREAKRLGLDGKNEQKTTRKRRSKYCHLLIQFINDA